MDIDEWEFLSDDHDGFLDLNEEGAKKKFLGKRNMESKSAFDMDSPPRSPRVHHNNQLVPVLILSEPRIGGEAPNNGLAKDITKNHHPTEVATLVAPSATTEKTKASNIGEASSVATDHDTVSQVFFKIKENEFFDMKMDSPKSSSRALKLEDKGEPMEIVTSPRMKIEKDVLSMGCDEEDDSTWEEESAGGFNIWKLSLTGVGAICSFGVVAATICFLFFGSHQKRNKNKLHQDHKIRFQIYTDDKRIKQVVQHATKFNEAISGVTGVPMGRAHITIGGFYDGL